MFTIAVLLFVEGTFKPGVQNVGANGECVCSASRRHIQGQENTDLKDFNFYKICQYQLYTLFLIT